MIYKKLDTNEGRGGSTGLPQKEFGSDEQISLVQRLATMCLLLFEIYKKGLERGKDQVDGCHCTKEKNIFQKMLS